MATTIDGKGNEYLLTFSLPETDWILLIAKALGMTKETVVGAAMNKGLCHYVGMLREAEEHDKAESHAEGKDKPNTGG